MNTQTEPQISRRSIAKGVAWATPTIIAASAAPAFAASPPDCLYTVDMSSVNTTSGTQTYVARNQRTGRVLTFTASSTMNGTTGTPVNMTNDMFARGASSSFGSYSTINSSFQQNGLMLAQYATGANTCSATRTSSSQTVNFTITDQRTGQTIPSESIGGGSMTVVDISSQATGVTPANWRQYWDQVTFSSSATRTGGTNTGLNATSGTTFYVTGNNQVSASTKVTDNFSFTKFPTTVTYGQRGSYYGVQFIQLRNIQFYGPC
ncbi:hypothetical protein RF638_10900 [Kocuria sp. CPCC 205235]|uniref:hypothetical protein n=1 Tax=Kocuria sp. CPCC 205235 TaxID=3073549 RepID=UPI0034D697F9